MSTSEVVIYRERIRHNLQVLTKDLPENVQKMAVIKADAYGHGAVEVARYLHDSVDWFGLATLQEALELRDAGITLPLLVFEPPEKELAGAYEQHNITAVVSSIDHFDILERGTEYHLEFDTGMGRLGFLPSEAEDVAKRIQSSETDLRCTGLMTHFACADNPETDTVQQQLNTFEEVCRHFPDKIMYHTANTGGVLYHSDTAFDMVRLGIGLYGYEPSGRLHESDLKPVMEWRSKVVQSKKIPKGWAVSYTSTWNAPQDGWLSVIPVGYADGLPRTLSNKLDVKIGGEWFRQAGIITMDYFMVFTGNQRISPGEDVLIMGGENNHADRLAEQTGTISYEIITRIHPKVNRTYQ